MQFKFLTSGSGGGPSSNILLRIGIKKAAVFPEPGKKDSQFQNDSSCAMTKTDTLLFGWNYCPLQSITNPLIQMEQKLIILINVSAYQDENLEKV